MFGIKLDAKEKLDDFIYITNAKKEMERMKSSNSDAIDVVLAFTQELKLLEQTNEKLRQIEKEMNTEEKVRILLEGPARSGKTIIASSLLALYPNSKFLLMNYFFYQAIVDGFQALSSLTTEEIDTLVKNQRLDSLIEFQQKFLKESEKNIGKILENFNYAKRACKYPQNVNVERTKQLLLRNMEELFQYLEEVEKELDINYNELPMLEIGIMHLRELQEFLLEDTSDNAFVKYGQENIYKLEKEWKDICNNDYAELKRLEKLIVQTIEELISHSKQRFFHHNINTKKSSKVTEGCWITRGNPTQSKMWTKMYTPDLIICDEAQRLGLIAEFGDRDSFDEIEQILSNSKKTFFTGDSFQMLNVEYDKGIKEIERILAHKKEKLIRFDLPETVGIPTEVGMLMKYFTHQKVNKDELIQLWQKKHDFEIIFIKQNKEKLVELFDEDKSSKKHFASPLDKQWGGNADFVVEKRVNEIQSKHKKKKIVTMCGEGC